LETIPLCFPHGEKHLCILLDRQPTANIQSLRDISPDMGAYINEVST